jgi:hypothetical protein
MITLVKCKTCGLEIASTTVTAKFYKKGEVIDVGCPYCGHHAPLIAIMTRKKRRTIKDEPDTLYLGNPVEEE